MKLFKLRHWGKGVGKEMNFARSLICMKGELWFYQKEANE